MILLPTNRDVSSIVTSLFQPFKNHLRILHDDEDDMIRLYLQGAIEAIEAASGNDIAITSYKVEYVVVEGIEYSHEATKWYCGKWDIKNVKIVNVYGTDVTNEFTIDNAHGIIYPKPYGYEITFDVGYSDAADMSANLVTLIFRYGAHLYENREAVRIGEPKLVPDWVNYALPSVWKPRV